VISVKFFLSLLLDEHQQNSNPLIPTEMMIMAGETIGKWKLRLDREANDDDSDGLLKNGLRLPFRNQPQPDYRARERDQSIMMDLLEANVGGGYCHAWYSRRFMSPVKITEFANPHFGLGLACYVQWSSPIRRFGDLQVHCAVKRYARRQKINELIKNGDSIPSGLTWVDLGCVVPTKNEAGEYEQNGTDAIDEDIDYRDRGALLGAVKSLQRSSHQYWLFEHIRRVNEQDPGKQYEVLVLGCVDPERRAYAVYFYELGFEYRYISPVGSLGTGNKIKLKVASVFPRSGQLTLIRADA
jgi:hypothetical protein